MNDFTSDCGWIPKYLQAKNLLGQREKVRQLLAEIDREILSRAEVVRHLMAMFEGDETVEDGRGSAMGVLQLAAKVTQRRQDLAPMAGDGLPLSVLALVPKDDLRKLVEAAVAARPEGRPEKVRVKEVRGLEARQAAIEEGLGKLNGAEGVEAFVMEVERFRAAWQKQGSHFNEPVDPEDRRVKSAPSFSLRRRLRRAIRALDIKFDGPRNGLHWPRPAPTPKPVVTPAAPTISDRTANVLDEPLVVTEADVPEDEPEAKAVTLGAASTPDEQSVNLAAEMDRAYKEQPK